MRRTDFNKLNEPYPIQGGAGERLASALGADIPNARELANEVLSDLDETAFGLQTLISLSDQERILISDYLYQCASSIEDNFVEAKLHFLEWQDTADKLNSWLADMISTETGEPIAQNPAVSKPADDLPHVLEKLHICGFFRAIGSAIDCLGACIIAILGLPKNLRRADISKAQRALNGLTDDGTLGRKIQIEYKDFLVDSISAHGPEDWLIWATQYRNMFVHRGRRIFMGFIEPIATPLFDAKGNLIPRSQLIGHLAKYPDKSDVEAMLLGGPSVLNEGTEVTLTGIFKSTRDFLEINCEEILRIWRLRKQDPSLITQPSQWQTMSSPCLFNGYNSSAPTLSMDTILTNPKLGKRLKSAAVMDHQRQLWTGTGWLTP